jgi:hypothetical protein
VPGGVASGSAALGGRRPRVYGRLRGNCFFRPAADDHPFRVVNNFGLAERRYRFGHRRGPQKKECLILTNKAVMLLKTKDRENEQSRTNPIAAVGKPCKTEWLGRLLCGGEQGKGADLKVGTTPWPFRRAGLCGRSSLGGTPPSLLSRPRAAVRFWACPFRPILGT